MAAPLDAEKAERKVWIVRVPPYVAKQWHAAISRSAAAAVDEDAHPEVLGQVVIQQGVATTLQIPGEPGAGGPQALHMNPNRDTVDTAVLSFEPAPPPPAGKAGAAAPPPGILLPKVDGSVHKRYDAAPVQIADAPADADGGQPGVLDPDLVKRDAEQRQRRQAQVDAAYLHSSRARLAAAARPAARKVEVIDDVKEVKRLAGGTVPLYSQQRAARTKVRTVAAAGGPAKRMRMGRDELEAELFKKFGEQPHWHFVQLQKEVDQPVAYLKEVLNDLAVQVKRGPHKDLWELKKHLQTGGRGGGGGGGAPAAPAPG
ncbi:tfg2 [Scenedesmus sp. PABB004]|nr:tfg2 [Scenedesmus sp. PABB004]